MFWRVHWKALPSFGPQNAKSIVWGQREGEPCFRCDGTGDKFVFNDVTGKMDRHVCPYCSGTGVGIATPGYSTCIDAEELYNYFEWRGLPTDDDADIVVFSGTVVGVGEDGENLVIPKEKPRPRFLKPSKVWALVDARRRNRR